MVLYIRLNGIVKDGILEGKASIRYPEGALYEGEFKYGKIEGKDTQKGPDGSEYSGNLKRTCR